MKSRWLLSMTLIACSSVLAQNAPTKPATDSSANASSGGANKRQQARFEKMKEAALSNLDKRIKLLTNIKSCVEDSETIEELKECKPEKPAEASSQ